jgi:hypothetical protein
MPGRIADPPRDGASAFDIPALGAGFQTRALPNRGIERELLKAWGRATEKAACRREEALA